ncbi:MAG: hypothetical protein ACK4K7_12420 [Allosphingosinicella sp.]|uniref:hypothetical protein n=1 Tax=Allosphingosinicella sp. TaxID=2823234 RepID=UPI003946FB4D
MTFGKWIVVAGAAALIAGCEARIGGGEEQAGGEGAAANASVSAEGKAEDGRVSIKAPGLDLSINIPDAIARRAVADAESKVVPPGARFGGMHVEGGGEGGQGEVELRFAVADPPEAVAAWYRDPARSGDFTVGESRREGDATVLTGVTGTDANPFTARLAPGAGGGTDIRLLLRDRN